MCHILGLTLYLYYLDLVSYPSLDLGGVIAPYYQEEKREVRGEMVGMGATRVAELDVWLGNRTGIQIL